MPTILSHPAVLLALRPLFKLQPSIYVTGAICSVLPDLDVIGFAFGIQYGDLLGHRGFSHSIFFAVLLSAVLTLIFFRMQRIQIFAFLFLCTTSHGVFDAFTNGGLGVAFFSPFSNSRYFFPVQPLEVSPIGIRHFLYGPALLVLTSELMFIWIPCLILFFIGYKLKKQHLDNEVYGNDI